MSLNEQVKRKIWNIIYPLFPYFERIALFAHTKKRQRFHIGWLAPGKTLREMQDYLSHEHQFGNHFVAWEDPDQVLSWRKLEGFNYQYHLRVYRDGELRGHYERTPESAPLDHFLEKGETARTKEFVAFLGPYVTNYRYVQHPYLHSIRSHEPEITADAERGK